jgi:hypothetical protein
MKFTVDLSGYEELVKYAWWPDRNLLFCLFTFRSYLEMNEEVGEQSLATAMLKDFVLEVFKLEAKFFVNQGKNLLEIPIN